MASDKELFQEAWRQGFIRAEGLRLRAQTTGHASKIRFGLYNAVKAYRDGRGEPDQALKDAIGGCSVTIVGTPERPEVLITRKMNSELAQSLLAQLGEPLTVEEHKANESMARIMAKVERDTASDQVAADTPKPINPGSKYGARG